MFRVGGTSDRLWNLTELVAYLAQNQNQVIELAIDPEAVCLNQLGLYKLLDSFSFKQVNIYTMNPLEHHDIYNIVYEQNYLWFYNIGMIDHALHVWNKKKIFYCLYGRPTAGRLGLASYLLAHHAEKSQVHFSAITDDDNLIQFELDKLLHYRKKSILEVGNLINQLPVLLSDPSRYTAFNGYDYDDPLTKFYQNILIDVVVESHVSGRTFFVTEKTVRPMLLKKPFIIFASRDYLDYLHQMGFKTFCEFWSENYDGFEGRDRFNMILDLLDSLACKSSEELESMYNKMKNILDHNYNLVVNKNFNRNIQEIL